MKAFIHYVVGYWDCKDANRNKEVIDTINRNIESGFFDKISVFTPNPTEKIQCEDQIQVSNLTYQRAFDSSIRGINILANSDILFDESILLADDIIEHEDFACLTRYESDGNLHKHDDEFQGSDSQDVWIWRDSCRVYDADFDLGVAGCDNRIAAEACLAEYNVINPSKRIQCWHRHETTIRTGFSEKEVAKMMVPPPYKLVEVEGNKQFNINHPMYIK